MLKYLLFMVSLNFILADGQSLIESKCCRCHKPGKEKGGMDLQSILPDKDKSLLSPKTWSKALVYLKSHEMPPADSKHLDIDDRQKMISWLDTAIYRTYAALPLELKTPQARRLNNKEYINTLQDLLFLKEKPQINLPNDNSGYGFDNIAELLSVSPLSMEKYLHYAKQYLDKAIKNELPKRSLLSFDAEGMDRRPEHSGRVINGVHYIWSLGKLSTEFPIEYSGKYKLVLRAAGDQAGEEPVHVNVMINEKSVGLIKVSAMKGQPQDYELNVDFKLGKNKIALAFVNDYNHLIKGDRNFHFHKLSVSGPNKLPLLTKSHLALVPNDEVAEQSLKRFLLRAYRRPVTEAELSKYMKLYHKLKTNGQEHLLAMKTCFLAALVSPKFLFRIEEPPLKGIEPISNYELASRLSYFLWSTMPDERLFSLAKQGKLIDDEVLSSEVERMIKSCKSKAFVKNFSGQWLYVRNLDYLDIDKKQFPNWNGPLQYAMGQEVYHYFSYVLQNDLPLDFFIRGDKLFVNDKLAKHYGIRGKFSGEFKETSAITGRDSILTTSAILTVTSEASRTSPVKRGKWVLEEILGFSPPSPPPDLPSLEDLEADHKKKTIAEQMAIHRADPNCAVCHVRMDPIGLSFEHYGPLGKWRASYEYHAINAGGILPNGVKLNGVKDVQEYLLKNKDVFQFNFIKKLMIYSLGRGLEEGDYQTLYNIYNDTKVNDCRLSQIILQLVHSKTFREKS
ncbi:DUF1592 domain-containing protein [Lentisphaera profundi]|uniref:DUF1592 domain-containing protein n=1 Tax=Lentisphaera profundi TaxID=1658616 RepID=A0ABY7VV84_9BACT|nr:DUF1592 domain-containing protein [Lentisphaera profundi]WDE97982.1 DUF1592 domain-containing protein [Lentisphaera profundi]